MLHDEHLVPCARFGAALHRVRSQHGVTMTSLSRASDGRFLPDDLVAVERGEVVTDDEGIRLLVGMYGLESRPWSPASALALVLDRAPMSDFGASSPVDPDVSRDETVRWVACRFVALSVLLGIDMTSGPVGVDVLAEALELSVPATVELVDDVLRTEAPTIGGMIEAMQDRVAVPEVGFLVAETAMGSLLLVGRHAESAPVVPACGTVFELVDAAR